MESDVTILNKIHNNPGIAKKYIGYEGIVKELILTKYVEDFINTGLYTPDIIFEIREYIDYALEEELYENIVLLNDVIKSLEQLYYG